jgi:hypothetical protein
MNVHQNDRLTPHRRAGLARRVPFLPPRPRSDQDAIAWITRTCSPRECADYFAAAGDDAD